MFGNFVSHDGRSVGRNFLLHGEADGGSDRMSHEVIVLFCSYFVRFSYRRYYPCLIKIEL